MRVRALLVAAGLAATAVTATPVAAQEEGDASDLEPTFTEVPLDGVASDFVPALDDPERTVSVILELTGDPVAVERAEAIDAGVALSAAQEAQVQQDLEGVQQAVVAEIERLGGRVHSTLQHAYNGIRARVPEGKVPEIADLPGVVRVHPGRIATADNTTTAELFQMPLVWEQLGFTGREVKVGVIDTGIDYYHANFGGSGDPADYADDDRTVIEPGTFPTAKVAGGVDFVGDDFDPQSDDTERHTPVPDPDPLDCAGHGTHVAGTVAGNGVKIDRTPYTGPYDQTTLANGVLVGPGFAPEATLYALKTFGCTGGTTSDLTVEALDWAVANDLDVVNLSLGAAFGRVDDADAVAATNAARAGVVVVAGAGNAGPGPYIMNTPAAGAGALAVAAVDTFLGFPVARFTTSTGSVLMLNANGSTAIPVGAAVRLLTDEPSTPANESLGCAFDDYATVQPGEIVVTRRGQCTVADRVTLATQSNAGAMVMISQGPFAEYVGGQGGAIPVLSAFSTDEAVITSAAGSTALIEVEGTSINPDFASLSFTSSGPRNGDSGLKPDVTAPGVNIFSSRRGTGFRTMLSSGTSMATAFVSGIAALVREARPDWTVPEVKAAIINTAIPLGDPRRSTSAGSGLTIPSLALSTEVVAMGDETGGGLSFGLIETPGPAVATKTITLTNRSNRAATYAVSPELQSDAGQPTVTFSQDSVTVPPRGGATVDVTLQVNGLVVPPSVLVGQPAMAAGNVVFTPQQEGEPALRVPFSSVLRGTSTVSTTPQSAAVADEITFTSTNADGPAGTVDVFAWGLDDPEGDAPGTDVRNVGFQAHLDQGLGVFAIHAATVDSNPSVNEWNVMLDTDGDDEPDYAVVGRDAGLVRSGPAGIDGSNLLAVVTDLDTDKMVSAFSAITSTNTGMVLLPFRLADVGLTVGGQEEFSYAAGVVSLETGRGEDLVDGTARFNPFTPPVQTGQSNVSLPGAPAQWTATVNRAQLALTPVKGWLVVYRFNRGGTPQAQPIPLG